MPETLEMEIKEKRVDALLEVAKTALAAWAGSFAEPEANRLDVAVPSDDVLTAVATLKDWGYLAAITGLDAGATSGKLEVLYQYCAGSVVVTLRVETPRDSACVPSVCGMLHYASFFERELSEMFGITVLGTPDPSRLFLPDDWPDGVYPLRKDALVEEATVQV